MDLFVTKGCNRNILAFWATCEIRENPGCYFSFGMVSFAHGILGSLETAFLSTNLQSSILSTLTPNATLTFSKSVSENPSLKESVSIGIRCRDQSGGIPR
ncbi:MAG: hypothetical protein ABS79_06845 [Planctomycetes bacterium SCN 63-9]|nr:MAG: hypothetical protein ABS79_06845 [Planctomycetes bacterium SCN 63-9]